MSFIFLILTLFFKNDNFLSFPVNEPVFLSNLIDLQSNFFQNQRPPPQVQEGRKIPGKDNV